ncbi:MAG: hypothetical protein IPJ82_00665 [Lewinellaceae bacterium]|nr:hypothetical protein [Lewinellaceae bacterium]
MENEEKTLTPQESLRVIRETIDLAKHSFRENGFHFLLWGWLVVIASVANYYFSEIQPIERPDLAWLVMVVIGVPVALIRESRQAKKTPVQNIVRDWYGLIWLGFGISMLLVIPMAVRNGLSPIPFILVLVGFATFMSGILLRFKPLLFGAAVVWAGALWCLFLNPSQHLLVQAGTAILGYLLPGYLLNLQSRAHVQGT